MSSDNQQPQSVFDLFSKSTELVKANLNNFVVLYAIPFLIGLMQVSSNKRTGRYEGFFAGGSIKIGAALGLAITMSLVIAFMYIITSLMLVILEFKAAKGKVPTLSEIWQQTKKYGLRLLGLAIALVLLVAVGLIALIVPGVIFISRYFLAPFAMIDEDLSISDALKRSREISDNHWGSIWTIIGLMIVIGIVGGFGILGWAVSFVLTALFSVAPALRYFELKKIHQSK